MRPTRHFLCVDCEHTWRIPFRAERPEVCPRCGSACFGRLTWMRGHDSRQVRGARGGSNPWRLADGAREDRYAE